MPPCESYGDTFSIIGMVNYFLNYYEKVFIQLKDGKIIEYFNDFFKSDVLYGDRIFITSTCGELIDTGEYDEFHFCNLLTLSWDAPQEQYKDSTKINEVHYFNQDNPIYRVLDIPLDHMIKPNKIMPNKIITPNHIFYYELVGLSNTVRMEYFNYTRDIDMEKKYSMELLEKHKLKIGDKYNIINNPITEDEELLKYINNDYPVINLNFAAPCVGFLLDLIEGAEEIHLIEGLNTNFLYHCQYKNIFKYDKTIYLHDWLRRRNWPLENMNMDYSYKMFMNPKLKNWDFIFQDTEK